MKKNFVALFAESPVHVGAGNSVGVVDSPVMRERHTRIPVIPGSSLKGVFSSLWTGARKDDSEARALFGSEDAKNAAAGQLLIGEARVLAFPVRSAKNAFAWITCPLALERFRRDSGLDFEIPQVSDENKCFAAEKVQADTKLHVILEEYIFDNMAEDEIDTLAECLKDVSDAAIWRDSLADRLVVVSDEIFSYFVENACEIVSRCRIDDETGTVAKGALFNQEQVPSETLFYFPIFAQSRTAMAGEQAMEAFKKKVAENGNMIQVGGDETIGLGFCEVKFN
jgi:CRISPR-associated protein Cmr4